MNTTVYTLRYEMLDETDHGELATYSNYEAAEQARLYALSKGRYYRVWIEETDVFDKFNTYDF